MQTNKRKTEKSLTCGIFVVKPTYATNATHTNYASNAACNTRLRGFLIVRLWNSSFDAYPHKRTRMTRILGCRLLRVPKSIFQRQNCLPSNEYIFNLVWYHVHKIIAEPWKYLPNNRKWFKTKICAIWDRPLNCRSFVTPLVFRG